MNYGTILRNGMLIGIPSAEAGIKPPHESRLPINYAKFLVMGPEKNYIIRETINSL